MGRTETAYKTMNENLFLPTSLETIETTLNEAGFSDIATGPTFEKSNKKTTLEKTIQSSGWGAKVQTLLKNRQSSVFALGGLLLAIAVMFAAGTLTNSDSEALDLASVKEIFKTGQVETLPLSDTPINLTVNTTGDFVQKASSGEGVTHLARKTIDGYLAENNTALNAEQKIYAEDFLKDRVGSFKLSVGQEVVFSQTDVKAAVAAAETLTASQIENLTQYTK